jgi:hypothetical protein
LDSSLLLLAGALGAIVWANVDMTTYERVARPLHFWINDIGMVFFFALGLITLAVFYPSGPLSIMSLVLLMGVAMLAAFWLKRRGIRSFWPYVAGPGALSWALFFATAAFAGGSALAETKMGALLSFVAAPIAFFMSRGLRVRASAR